jgi:lipoprotein-releasing system permease protein
MNLPFSLFLALKYLKPKRTFVSVITVISILGVMLGVAVLIIVLSVMSGFDHMWRDKILSFNAHITISGYGPIDAPEELLTEIAAVEGVTGAAPYVEGLVFLQHRNQIYTPLLRGIDPDYELAVSRVPEHLVAGDFDIVFGEMVIGRDLALQMGVQVGDRILVYSPQSFVSPDQLRLPEELTVTGIYELGMWDFDMGYTLTSLGMARDLYGMEQGVHGIQVMTEDPYRVQAVADRLQTLLGSDVRVRTWMEMNRQLFAALRVEKNMMFFLLIFITIVAAFGITNTLITLTVQKTREIGLLKALGYSSGSVMRVFFWQGWIEGVIGTAAGIGLGLTVLKYRNDLMNALSERFGWELFPKELYHLSEIPASTSTADLVLISVSVLVICTLAGVVPAYRAASLDPARALRNE